MDIKAKINKLLEIGDHTQASDTERETAIRQAAKLMEKHGIDLAQLEEHEFKEEVGAVDSTKFNRESKIKWIDGIWWSAATLFGCRMIINKRYSTYDLIGTQLARDNSQAFAVWLIDSVRKEAKSKYKLHKTECKMYGIKPDAPRTFHTSFGNGVSSAIRERVQEALPKLEEIKQTATGNALIAVNRDIATKLEVNVFVSNKYPRLGTGAPSTSRSASAYQTGRLYGSSVSLAKKSAVSGYLN